MRVDIQNCVIAAIGGLLSFSAIAQTANSPVQPRPIPRAPALAVAIEAAQVAVATCTAKGFKVAATVVDAEGGVKAMIVADGQLAILGEFARRKALTSAFFKLPTSTIEQQMKTDQALAAKIAAEPSKFFTFAGGVPLSVNNEIVGAIGVGGASDSKQDELCAMEAIAKIQDRLR